MKPRFSTVETQDGWYEALIASETRYLTFRISSDEQEKKLANYYGDTGEIALANAEWIIIEIPMK